MKIKHVALSGIILSTLGGWALPAAADIKLGDILDLQYNFTDLGSVWQDPGPFTFTGAGQSLLTQDGFTTVVLSNNVVAFEESPGCGPGCWQTPANWNGPVLFDQSNPTAFAGWRVLSDTVGITSAYLTPGAIGVNWQGVPVQGAVTVGVPGPIAGAGLPALVGLVGFGVFRRRRAMPD